MLGASPRAVEVTLCILS